MRKIVFVLFVVTSLQNAFSQDFELVRHQVQLGETVRMLSKKYKVEPSEIYRLNKFAVDGISKGMVLEILVPRKDAPSVEVAQETVMPEIAQNDNAPNNTQAVALNETGESISHTVAKGETLYSLSKKYNVTVDVIKTQNEEALKKGLQIGQVLIIKAKN